MVLKPKMKLSIFVVLCLTVFVKGKPSENHLDGHVNYQLSDLDYGTDNDKHDGTSTHEEQEVATGSATEGVGVTESENEHKDDEGEADGQDYTVAGKLNGIFRKQVLKKAGKMAGEEVHDSGETALAIKVAAVARDAAIRKLTPRFFSKTLHSGVDFVKNRVESVNEESMTNRDLDLHNERVFAREVAYKVADRVADTISSIVGGTIASRTVNKLHKDNDDKGEHLGGDTVEEFLEDVQEEAGKDDKGSKKDKHSKHTKGKHGESEEEHYVRI